MKSKISASVDEGGAAVACEDFDPAVTRKNDDTRDVIRRLERTAMSKAADAGDLTVLSCMPSHPNEDCHLCQLPGRGLSAGRLSKLAGIAWRLVKSALGLLMPTTANITT